MLRSSAILTALCLMKCIHQFCLLWFTKHIVQLPFNPGDQMTPQCVNITIVDDTAVENSSIFFLAQVTSALLATPHTVTIIILNDNDA